MCGVERSSACFERAYAGGMDELVAVLREGLQAARTREEDIRWRRALAHAVALAAQAAAGAGDGQ